MELSDGLCGGDDHSGGAYLYLHAEVYCERNDERGCERLGSPDV